jgi:hypothetical protein
VKFYRGSGPSYFYYDQIEYDIPDPVNSVNLSFDIFAQDLIGSNSNFTIFFDAPQVNTIQIRNDGSIFSDYLGQIGTFSDDVSMHFDMWFSIPEDRLDIILNAQLLGTRPIYSTSERDLNTIRFSLGSTDMYSNATVYLDNVSIVAVPLAGPYWLFLVGIISGLMPARRRFRYR